MSLDCSFPMRYIKYVKMKVLNTYTMVSELARALKKPCLFLGLPPFDEHVFETIKAAPYLNFQEHTQALMDGQAVIVCDTSEERDRLFDLTIGDDGPTETNPYSGPAKVFAMTISEDGEILTENT